MSYTLAPTRVTSADPVTSAGRGTTSALAAVRGLPVDWDTEKLRYELDCLSAGQADRTIKTRLCSIRSMALKLGTAGPDEVTRNGMARYFAAEIRRRTGAGRHPLRRLPVVLAVVGKGASGCLADGGHQAAR